MKTLKQRLQEECDGQMTYLAPEQVIKIVKEWLEQKCQYLPNTPYKDVQNAISTYIRDKLLEYLKE